MISSNSLPSKAGAKVQTFFHSAKLFLKKNHNTLIYKIKKTDIPRASPLHNAPLFRHFSVFLCLFVLLFYFQKVDIWKTFFSQVVPLSREKKDTATGLFF